MAKDWVPCFGYGVAGLQDVPFLGTDFVIPLVGTGLGLDTAGNQVGYPDTDPESVLVHRTVGQLSLELISDDPGAQAQIRTRFTTAIYNNTLNALFPFTVDLYSGADANEGFMSERTMRLDETRSTAGQFVDPRWSHWDITTKRALRSAEWTCLVVNVRPDFDGDSLTLRVQHFLRSWVTTSQ